MAAGLRILSVVVFSVLLFEASSFGEDEDVVVAKIGDRKIMMSDFNRISGYDADKKRLMEQNPNSKANLLKTIVHGSVVGAIAREHGFDKRPDVKEQLEILTNSFLAAEYIKKEIIGKIKVSEDDAKLYYEKHRDEFKTPEMVRVRHILVRADKKASEEAKKKAREKAEDLLRKVRAGEDFAKLASESSEDAGTKSRGGDLGFLRRGRMGPDFEKAAFSLKPGEVSDLVETQYGFHIIKSEEKKESLAEPYDKVRERAREKAFAEFRRARIEEFLNKAMKDAGAEMKPELLSGPEKQEPPDLSGRTEGK